MTDLENRRKRILYRAWHRGTRELDMLLGRYAQEKIQSMRNGDLDRFETLMSSEEPQLMAWLTGVEAMPEDDLGDLLTDIRAFHAARPVAQD